MVKILDMQREEVIQKIRGGRITISVIGLGYIGLPLAVLFASEGSQVIGCVRTEESARKINRGETRVIEHDVTVLSREGATILEVACPNCGVPLFKLEQETFCPSCGRLASVTSFGVHLEDNVANAQERIVKARQSLRDMLQNALKMGRFHSTTRTSDSVRKSDVVLITVGTPVDQKNAPDYTDLQNACHDVGRGLQKDALVVLKSTVSPGTTENLVMPILEDESKLKAGKDFGLAFMPETIKEGHALYEFRTLPRIVGGITKRCAAAAASLFSVFPAPVYIYEKTSIVEMAKLFMNIYRDVNIALANEFALICEKVGVDVIQASNAANIDPKTHLLTPGLVGGYCLPKDTYQLSHPSIMAGYSPRLITLARQLNEGMVVHIVNLVEEVFKEMHLSFRDARITVLGLGFKANSGDLRNTPAKPLIDELVSKGARVIGQDPLVPLSDVNQNLPKLTFTRSLKDAVQGASCTVIVTDHLEYRGLTASYLKKLMTSPCAIVDARHIINPEEAKKAGVVFRGLGKPPIMA